MEYILQVAWRELLNAWIEIHFPCHLSFARTRPLFFLSFLKTDVIIFFRSSLGSRQNWGGGRGISQIPSTCTHAVFPVIDIPSRGCIYNNQCTCIDTSSSPRVCCFHSRCAFCGFGRMHDGAYHDRSTPQTFSLNAVKSFYREDLRKTQSIVLMDLRTLSNRWKGRERSLRSFENGEVSRAY